MAVAAAGFQNASVEAAAASHCRLASLIVLRSEPPAALLIAALFFLLHSVFDWAHRPGLLSVQFVRIGGRWAAGSMAHTSRFCVCSHGSGKGSMAEIRTNVGRPRLRRSLLVAVTVMTGAGNVAAQRGQPAVAPARTPTRPPRLIVFLVVDQMRADYVSMYGHQWTKGLRRLDTGAYFPMAAYPHSYTVTCAGHATIGTGTYPATRDDRQRMVRPGSAKECALY